MAEEIVWGAGMDDKDFQAGVKRMIKTIDDLKQKVKELQAAAKQSNDEQKNAFEVQNQGSSISIASLGRMALGWVSVQSAMKLVVAEYENIKTAQSDAADETIQTANAQIGFLRNLGNVSREERNKVIGDMKAIAAEVKQPVKNVYMAAQSSISAQGVMTQQQMYDSLRIAFKLAPESLTEQQSIAGALGDVASLTGHGDPERNAAFLIQANKQARAETLTQIAQNSLGRAISIKQRGGTGPEALALTNTFSGVMKDREGQISSTAALRLAGQLAELKVPGNSTIERIRYLQENPAKAKRFFDKASFEGGIGEMPSRAITTKGTEAATLLEQNIAGMNTAGGPGSGQLVRQFIGDLQAVPEQQVAAKRRELITAASGAQTANLKGGMSAVNREGVDKLLQSTGAFATDRWASRLMYETSLMQGNSPEVAAFTAISGPAAKLKGRIDEIEKSGGNAGVMKEHLEILKDQLRELKEMRKAQIQESAKPTKKNADAHTE